MMPMWDHPVSQKVNKAAAGAGPRSCTGATLLKGVCP
jgi:hypothetical protein